MGHFFGWYLLYFLFFLRDFVVTCTFVSADAQIASPAQKSPLSNSCCLSMVPTSQLFEVTVSGEGVHDFSAKKGCRSYRLEINTNSGQIGRWSCLVFMLVQIIRPWLLPAGSRMSPLPPPLTTPPPHAAKDYIYGQLLGALCSHLTPPPCLRQWLLPFVHFHCCVFGWTCAGIARTLF